MTHNPYAPPATAVSDAPIFPEMPRPWQVKLSLWLIVAALALVIVSLALEIMRTIRMGFGFLSVDVPGLMVMGGLIAGVVLMLAWCINRGHRWARIVYSAFAALFLIAALRDLPALFRPTWYDGAILSLALVLAAISVCLIFTPPSNAWFQRPRN